MAAEPARLYRSARDKMLCGVAGGLARYFDIDPVIVRVLFVCATIFGGFGLLLYVVLAVVMPSEQSASGEQAGGADSPPETHGAPTPSVKAQRQRGLALILVAIGIIILLSQVGVFWLFNWGFIWAVALIVIGAVLFVRRS